MSRQLALLLNDGDDDDNYYDTDADADADDSDAEAFSAVCAAAGNGGVWIKLDKVGVDNAVKVATCHGFICESNPD